MGQPGCRIVGKTVEEWGEEAAPRPALPDARRCSVAPMPASGPRRRRRCRCLRQPASEADTGRHLAGFQFGAAYRCGGSRRRRRPCFSWARAASARKCSRATLHRLSARSDKPFVALNCAAHSGARWSSRNCSASSAALTPARCKAAPAGSSAPTAARCFSTRSARSRASAQGKLLARAAGRRDRAPRRHRTPAASTCA